MAQFKTQKFTFFAPRTVIFYSKFGMPFMTISTNLCLFVKIVITFNYFLGKCHMFAMEKHNLLI